MEEFMAESGKSVLKDAGYDETEGKEDSLSAVLLKSAA
jgi:hypothetical protein